MFAVDDLLVAVNKLVRAALDNEMPAGRLVIEFNPSGPHVSVTWQASGDFPRELPLTTCDRL